MPDQSAQAADVVQQPNPELLRRFEAERDTAIRDRQKAEEKIREGEAMVRRAEEQRRAIQQETDRELCRQGLLPANLCP